MLIPQTRARHFTVAVKSDDVDVDFKAISAPTVPEPRSVGWVIEDLQNKPSFRLNLLQATSCDEGESG